jgi:hypothetical protein
MDIFTLKQQKRLLTGKKIIELLNLLTLTSVGRFELAIHEWSLILVVFKCMFCIIRPGFEVVKKGRIY